MEYARETIQKAFKIYQKKYGGNLAEVSILFVNVMDALDEAAQQSVQRTCLNCGNTEDNHAGRGHHFVPDLSRR